MAKCWIGLLLVLVGVSRPAQACNTFGKDQREAITNGADPWPTIGYLSSGCTATLVGTRLILTAAHCVFNSKGEVPAYGFYPGMVDSHSKKSSAITYVWWGKKTLPGENTNPDDWAIAVLADPLGDTFGYMGTNPKFDGESVFMAGYSGDYWLPTPNGLAVNPGQTAAVHRDCRIRERTSSYWLHDCDATRGASGGPLFRVDDQSRGIIAALHVGERRADLETSLKLPDYNPEYANLAIPASRFDSKITEMREKYP